MANFDAFFDVIEHSKKRIKRANVRKKIQNRHIQLLNTHHRDRKKKKMHYICKNNDREYEIEKKGDAKHSAINKSNDFGSADAPGIVGSGISTANRRAYGEESQHYE